MHCEIKKMFIIRNMADSGKAIITTIHQPSSQVRRGSFSLHKCTELILKLFLHPRFISLMMIYIQTFAIFDRVLLIAEGRVAFLGDTDDAQKFFTR